jgi:hypothetical protein
MNKRLFSIVLMVTVSLLPMVVTPLISAEAASFNAAQSPRQIEYRVGLSPKQIWDGTIEYFKGRGFTTVVLIAADSSPYEQELQKIKQMGMYPILDIERVIWTGKTSVPIHTFHSTFDMWRRAGWTHVASEGGRSGDLDCLKNYFSEFTFFNCDHCGIWKDFHMHPFTSEMSWETFVTGQIPAIQRGALESYPLGKEQGILAGVWGPENDCRNVATYKALLDWSYASNVPFTHFHVFFDIGPTLTNYKQLGFESIVAELQKYYPPKPAPSLTPYAFITNVQLVPGASRHLMWEIANTGTSDVWVAPYATFYTPAATASGYAKGPTTAGHYVYNGAALTTTRNGWVKIPAGGSQTVFSPAVAPPNVRWTTYNTYAYYNQRYHGWLYSNTPYSAMK